MPRGTPAAAVRGQDAASTLRPRLQLIEYRFDIELWPRPSNCGKMYHIQCDRFRPLRILPLCFEGNAERVSWVFQREAIGASRRRRQLHQKKGPQMTAENRLTVTCPRCKAAQVADVTYIGKTVKCHKCSHKFMLRRDYAGLVVAEELASTIIMEDAGLTIPTNPEHYRDICLKFRGIHKVVVGASCVGDLGGNLKRRIDLAILDASFPPRNKFAAFTVSCADPLNWIISVSVVGVKSLLQFSDVPICVCRL